MTTRAFLSMIQTLAGQRFGVSLQQIRGTSRKRPLTLARHVALWLGRALTGESYPELGRRTGGLDHSAVMYACRRVAALLGTDPALRETVLSLRDRLAVNIPEGIGVGRRMHLTFQTERVVIEVPGEQAVEVPALLQLQPETSGMAGGRELVRASVWLAPPARLWPLWDRVCAPAWRTISIETAPDVFRTGRILMTHSTVPAMDDIAAKLGTMLIGADALLELETT
jgi:hypothetical protein